MRMHWSMALAALIAHGCASQPQATSHPQRPELVKVEPGVWVVREMQDPVYYDGYAYYTYRDGRWYRSLRATGGFDPVAASAVPANIASRRVAAPTPTSPYEPPPAVAPPTGVGGGPPPITPEVMPPPRP